MDEYEPLIDSKSDNPVALNWSVKNQLQLQLTCTHDMVGAIDGHHMGLTKTITDSLALLGATDLMPVGRRAALLLVQAALTGAMDIYEHELPGQPKFDRVLDDYKKFQEMEFSLRRDTTDDRED